MGPLLDEATFPPQLHLWSRLHWVALRDHLLNPSERSPHSQWRCYRLLSGILEESTVCPLFKVCHSLPLSFAGFLRSNELATQLEVWRQSSDIAFTTEQVVARR